VLLIGLAGLAVFDMRTGWRAPGRS